MNDIIKPDADYIITSHYSLDGDAVGSELALAEFIIQRGGRCTVINQDVIPRIYSFLDTSGIMQAYSPTRHDKQIAAADVIFVVDVSDWKRVGTPAEQMLASPARRVCIDHHVSNNAVGDIDFIDTSAAAAGMLVYDAIRSLGGTITPSIARALFTAIATDTGWFRFANTTPDVLEAAASLDRSGANPGDLHERIYEQLRPQRLALLGRGLTTTLRSAANGRIMWMTLTLDMFKETGADNEDVEGMIDLLRGIEGVKIAMLVREADDGIVRMSLRSKDDLDVGKLAAKFGGGGHKRAAGVRLTATLDEAIKQVVGAAEEMLEE